MALLYLDVFMVTRRMKIEIMNIFRTVAVVFVVVVVVVVGIFLQVLALQSQFRLTIKENIISMYIFQCTNLKAEFQRMRGPSEDHRV